MKKNLLILLGLVLSLGGILIAVDPPTMTNTIVQGDLRIPMKADLEVTAVEAYPCACETDTAVVDAMIVKGNIVVHVHNKGPFGTDAKIMVRVFNYRSGTELGYAKAIHLNKNEYASHALAIITPASPLLIKKSFGVRAEIVVNSAGVTDPVATNNKKTINKCEYIII